MVCLALIDDDIGYTTPGRRQWDVGRRIHGQRRSKSDDQVSSFGRVQRALHIAIDQVLSKADRRWLEQTSAGAPVSAGHCAEQASLRA